MRTSSPSCNLVAERRGRAVSGDPSRLDPFVRLAARANTGLADVFVEAHGFIRGAHSPSGLAVEESADLLGERGRIRIERVRGKRRAIPPRAPQQHASGSSGPRWGPVLLRMTRLGCLTGGMRSMGGVPARTRRRTRSGLARRQLEGDGSSETDAKHIHMAQPQIARQIEHGTRAVRKRGARRRIGFTESRQIGRIYRPFGRQSRARTRIKLRLEPSRECRQIRVTCSSNPRVPGTRCARAAVRI